MKLKIFIFSLCGILVLGGIGLRANLYLNGTFVPDSTHTHPQRVRAITWYLTDTGKKMDEIDTYITYGAISLILLSAVGIVWKERKLLKNK